MASDAEPQGRGELASLLQPKRALGTPGIQSAPREGIHHCLEGGQKSETILPSKNADFTRSPMPANRGGSGLIGVNRGSENYFAGAVIKFITMKVAPGNFGEAPGQRHPFSISILFFQLPCMGGLSALKLRSKADFRKELRIKTNSAENDGGPKYGGWNQDFLPCDFAGHGYNERRLNWPIVARFIA